jgi:hypothetical protein
LALRVAIVALMVELRRLRCDDGPSADAVADLLHCFFLFGGILQREKLRKSVLNVMRIIDQ